MDCSICKMHKSIHYHLHSLLHKPLFNYCNNLLFNIPAYKLNKLQTLKNVVARYVFQLPRSSSDSIKPLQTAPLAIN